MFFDKKLIFYRLINSSEQHPIQFLVTKQKTLRISRFNLREGWQGSQYNELTMKSLKFAHEIAEKDLKIIAEYLGVSVFYNPGHERL